MTSPMEDYATLRAAAVAAEEAVNKIVIKLSEAAAAYGNYGGTGRAWKGIIMPKMPRVHASRRFNRQAVNVTNWPSAEALSHQITEYWAVVSKLDEAWARLSLDQQAAVSPPPGLSVRRHND